MQRQSLITLARCGLLRVAALGGVLCGLGMLDTGLVLGQGDVSSGLETTARHSPLSSQATVPPSPIHLPYAQFQIPFSVDPTGPVPKQIQLWVSTDEGTNWQLHGTASPEAQHFPFRAASEGNYLFSVRSIDHQGVAFPSNSPPLRVNVDTTKPNAAVRADVDEQGRLAIHIRVFEEYLNPSSAELRLRTDRATEWRDVDVPELVRKEQFYEAVFTTSIPACREVALVFTIRDQAQNEGEATFQLNMPRTAQAEADLRLASVGVDGGSPQQRQRSSIPSLNGAMEWRPDSADKWGTPTAAANSTRPGPGQLASSEGLLQLNSAGSAIEELPLPSPDMSANTLDIPAPYRESATTADMDLGLPASTPMNNSDASPARRSPAQPATELARPDRQEPDASSLGQAYHCQSRAFSLDYSVEALGASALADIELWGTEDGGRQWSKWGSDPDRQSPFDVQVGNDGLFGFRMVVVGSNGIVSNRPKDGDPADVWINIDTTPPSVKISRAVYGDGPETGMLVIDYQCSDSHLVDQPVSLAYSESPQGPWNTFVSGLKNTGIYLWKANPSLPDRIYVKVEAVDKAGNVGSHRLDLPIDTKGLAPRGRIHGFRPIH